MACRIKVDYCRLDGQLHKRYRIYLVGVRIMTVYKADITPALDTQRMLQRIKSQENPLPMQFDQELPFSLRQSGHQTNQAEASHNEHTDVS